MSLFKKASVVILSGTIALSLCACTTTIKASGYTETSKEVSIDTSTTQEVNSELLKDYDQDMESLKFDNTVWNYDAENDVYWQLGVGYCTDPESVEYETMGIYIPGAYMTGVKNDDGTYTCTINKEGKINGYTAETAPIVFPVNTAGYSAQAAPTDYNYNGLSSYLDEGFIYVYAGMRGRSNGYDTNGNLTYSGGAPWGVTDLKAAVRYYRYNAELLPGDGERIFTFGHSGGGAQSGLMGATGDSELYYEYLTSIGAAMFDEEGNYISDSIMGAMTWCPITSLDYANEAYEWNMGQYFETGTRAEDTWTSALSKDLAESFATYINALGLKDEQGKVLTLEASENGIYAAGSYYDYILSVIETSLNNFLSDTQFPYTKGSGKFMGDGGFAGAGGGANGGSGRPSGDGMPSRGDIPNGEGMPGGMNGNKGTTQETTTYETVQDYIDALNADGEWVKYNATTNTATITSIEDFVTHNKNASKSVAAFDDLNRKQAENMVFGNDESDALHFDSVLAQLLEDNQAKYAAFVDWNASYIQAYVDDLTALDKFGNSIEYRQNMYNPMYYISDYYEGYGTSKVAPYWRIHTGIEQGDTAVTVEANLALALEQYTGIESVEFETVWGQGHTKAERTGDSTENFIQWVGQCVSESVTQ